VLNQRNPLFSFVQLRPDAASDGRLEVHEAYRLNLRAKVLILSACETGLASGAIAEVPAGDDWVGLVQAFLQAGAESVVATLWSVDDRATAQLIDAFYTQLIPTRSTSTALAQAQRLILGSKETRAPFYWAGFTLNGSLSQ
jgi:CHAT domain-containing protein